MRIVFELEPADLARFREALARAHAAVACAEECEILDAARHALATLPPHCAPGFVGKRLKSVARLIAMLEDEAWAMPAELRAEVLPTLAYFSDPEDLIPDHVHGVGLIDDAIMLELLVRRLRPLLDAYDDFCAFREADAPSGDDADGADRIALARRLAERRAALHARMRRRAARAADQAFAQALGQARG